MFSLRFLIFFFLFSQFSLHKKGFLEFCCCRSPKNRGKKKHNLAMLHECARNHRQQHKVFLPSLPSSCTRVGVFFLPLSNECASPRNNNTSTRDDVFLALALPNVVFFFLSRPVAVLRSRCVYFLLFSLRAERLTFSTTTVSARRDVVFCCSRKPRH